MCVIHLSKAWFCVNCEYVSSLEYEYNKDRCPVCGSKAIIPLSKWLNRKEDKGVRNGMQRVSNKED